MIKAKHGISALVLVLALPVAGGAADPQWTPSQQAAIAAWPKLPRPHRDSATEARIARIIAGMTLDQKVGQMTQAEIRSVTPDEVRRFALGSILNGGGAWPAMNRYATASDWADLATAYARAAMASDVHVPLIWGTDAVHGDNNVHGASIYPHNIGLGAANDPVLVGRIGRATARAVRATGIGWAFAPTLAVVQNPRWGRTYESYSSDPAVVARLGGAMVRGLQGNLRGDGDVLASAKHFIGDGGTFRGVDQGENRASPADLVHTHGAGYIAAQKAGVGSVMVSYSSWNPPGVGDFGKMHGDGALVTGVLRGRLGFDGLTVSDWNAIEQVPGCKVDHCPQAINAGVDMVMVPDDWKAFIANTVADVREGRIAMARIDEAVANILRVKFRMGLFAHPLPGGRYLGKDAALANRPLARRAAREAVVLLKNNATLPLRPGSRVLVIGKAADSMPQQMGGWSLTWQGINTENADFPNGETMLAGIRRAFGKARVTYSPDGSGFAPGQFDAVIAVLGEEPYSETRGDVRWPAPLAHSPRFPGDAEALRRVSGQGVPVVTLLYSGRPEYATDLINRSDAFIAGFLPGTEAGAIADLLIRRGHRDFRGRLPFNWPNTACPGGGEAAAEALFARGAGLTYAKPRHIGTLNEAPIPKACP